MGQVIKPIQYEPLLDMKQTEQGEPLNRASTASCHCTALRSEGAWYQRRSEWC